MQPAEEDELVRLKSEYAQALARNHEAKAQLKHAFEHSRAQDVSKPASQVSLKREHLTTHLDSLRLQRQYGNLQTLAHYVDKAEGIAKDEKLYEPLNVSLNEGRFGLDRTDESIAAGDIANAQQQVDALLNSAKTLTTNLELALVRARQQLKREQKLFDDAKAQSDKTSNGGNIESKLRALEVTRDELQTWIGDSLAACEQEVEVPNLELLTIPDDNGSSYSQGDAEAEVEDQYDRYIEARKRLFSAVSALRAPLPTVASENLGASKTRPTDTTTNADDQDAASQRPSHPRLKSNASVSKMGERPTTTSLAEMQSTHLPDYYHEKLLSTYTTHLKDQTLAQDAKLLQVLGLLSHESHLLPAHPLPSLEHGPGEAVDKTSQQQVDIDRLLRAWAFASDAAGEMLESNVQSQFEDARGALEKARLSMEEMCIMEDMKKEVFRTT
ncbi:hypothetical protein PMZ80_003476 [Knufia obscura]|uniref:Uncharacterized protein n=1 Tax=Knufia obscura TaxID=1635080 RepID=A0ABR0RVA0_9EURO|nr:hypothetical protein PMZ80_003476 [Knufia obscura]